MSGQRGKHVRVIAACAALTIGALGVVGCSDDDGMSPQRSPSTTGSMTTGATTTMPLSGTGSGATGTTTAGQSPTSTTQGIGGNEPSDGSTGVPSGVS
jgi:hypothetical protein